MSTPTLSLPFRTPAEGHVFGRVRFSVPRPELLALVLLAAVLNLWSLSTNGLANDYYAAAVHSMAGSWSSFLYGSFDASNVMTVDKPPLAFWVQALSVRAFGFNSWSMLVPQALMGVASVALTYDLVRRRFGRAAGFAAGLVLALTPVSVALARHNNPDALLTLCSVVALWALVRALEDGRTRWLVLSGVAVGLGFETKMAAALLVVPGIVAAYLWIAPRGRLVALRQLSLGGAAMAVVGLAWPVLMWLTPASSRPWISGTSDNSIWSLIFGYNGLGRLFGQDGGPAATTGAGTGAAAAAGGTGAAATAGAGRGGGGGGGQGSNVFGGDAGPFRLLNEALGGQAGWLLGFALVAGLAVLVASRLRRGDARTGWLIATGGAFLTIAVAFSRASGIFHPYYVSLLAPFTAMLVGAGVAELLRGGVLARVLGAAMIAAGVATELVVLHDNPDSFGWLPVVLVVGGIAASIALTLPTRTRVRTTVVAAVLGLLLVAPGAWAFQTLGHATSSTFPAGGPTSATQMGGPGGGGGGRPGGGGGGGRPAGGPPAGLAGGAPNAAAPGAAAGAAALPGPAATPGTATAPGATAAPGAAATTGTQAGGGGGMFGGNANTTEALAYAKANGGGTLAVSGQNGAGTQVVAGADIAAIGGFSGRESQVSVDWLADAVESGQIRWVLTDSGGGGPQDSRVGSSEVMAVAAQVGTEVPSISGLYDLQGTADALRAAG